jgi:hypothetical protein
MPVIVFTLTHGPCCDQQPCWDISRSVVTDELQFFTCHIRVHLVCIVIERYRLLLEQPPYIANYDKSRSGEPRATKLLHFLMGAARNDVREPIRSLGFHASDVRMKPGRA